MSLPGKMNGGMGNKEEKGLLLVLFNEADGVLGDEGGVVTFFFDWLLIVPPIHAAVSINMRNVIRGSMQMPNKLIKPVSSRPVFRFITKMPLPHHSCSVAHFL